MRLLPFLILEVPGLGSMQTSWAEGCLGLPTSKRSPRHSLTLRFAIGYDRTEGKSLSSETWPGSPRRPSPRNLRPPKPLSLSGPLWLRVQSRSTQAVENCSLGCHRIAVRSFAAIQMATNSQRFQIARFKSQGQKTVRIAVQAFPVAAKWLNKDKEVISLNEGVEP